MAHSKAFKNVLIDFPVPNQMFDEFFIRNLKIFFENRFSLQLKFFNLYVNGDIKILPYKEVSCESNHSIENYLTNLKKIILFVGSLVKEG